MDIFPKSVACPDLESLAVKAGWFTEHRIVVHVPENLFFTESMPLTPILCMQACFCSAYLCRDQLFASGNTCRRRNAGPIFDNCSDRALEKK
jgi:hypothetical protein